LRIKQVLPFPTVKEEAGWQGHFSAQSFADTPVDQSKLSDIKRWVRTSILNLPEEHTNALQDLKVRNQYHVSRGLANHEKIILNTSTIQNRDEMISVFIHELGHLVDLSVLSGDRGRLSNFKDDGKTIRLSDPSVGFYEISWETSTKRKKDADRRDFVSGYAMTNVFEDFAESYLFYRLHGDKFRRIMSQSEALRKKYDFLKEKVFNGEEFQTDHTDTTFVHNTIWDATLLPLTHSELIISD